MAKIEDNYDKIDTVSLDEYKAKGVRYTHKKTGCDIFHIECEDEENLFAFIFPTPPGDSTGLPHIIEHSVLSGSERFPVKDPFAQLLQGSMNTFLNAMTYPDKTVYPAASLVENDFFNLLKVYADAVFFPLLKREIFLQEGHHLHLTDTGSIVHSGVVYNEMMGNYSSAESIAGEWTTRSLFEQSTYRYDSGGEPAEIGTLTYPDFIKFHKTHYHPTNGKIFLYGSIPGEKLLAFLDEEIFSRFEEGEKVRKIEPEPMWKEPRRLAVSVPASSRSDRGKEGMLFVNWLIDFATDPLHLLSLEVLSEILLGNQGAPLYQKIIESGIADDVSPLSGPGTQMLQTVFTVGVRGTAGGKEKEFEELIFTTLGELADKGIPEQVVQGSLNRVEFRTREKRGGIPFGLRLLIRSLRGWLHGLSPEKTMEFETLFDELRQSYGGKPGYFEDCIRNYLITNPHRTTLTVEPDPAYKVQELPIDDSDSGIRKQAEEETELFNRFQEQTDSPEDLAAIPLLSMDDVPREIELIPTETEEFARGTRLYTHALETNGIAYIDIGFPVDKLTIEEQYFLPLVSHSVYKIGCKGLGYDELSRTLFEQTGGLTSMLEGSTTPEGGKQYLFFRLKTLESRFETGLSLLEQILTVPDLSRTDKMKDVLLEMRNDIASSVIPRGNQYAMLAAARTFQPALTIEEIWKGPDQLFFLHHLGTMETDEFRGLGEIARRLIAKIIHSEETVVNITAEPAYLDKAVSSAEKCIRALPDRQQNSKGVGRTSAAAFTDHPRLPLGGGKPLRLVIPAGIGFAAAALRASWLGTKGNAVESLLGHALRTGYLWEQVRMKGGAYGVSSAANGSEGLWSFTSYRDPRAGESLDTFRDSLEFAASGKLSDATLEKAVIGTVGKEVKKMPPGSKGFVGFRRKLYGISDEIRQQKRDYILDVRKEDLQTAAEDLLHNFRFAETVLLADEAALEKVKTAKTASPLHLPV